MNTHVNTSRVVIVEYILRFGLTPSCFLFAKGSGSERARVRRLLLCQIGLLAGRVNSQGRLGWGEGNPGDLGTIAGEARYRHQPGDSKWGALKRAPNPKRGGTGTAGATDTRAERVVSLGGSGPVS